MTTLSIVVPVLNEGARSGAVLARLAPLRARGVEVVAVDGGSTDITRQAVAPHCDVVIDAPRGRASQMNAGAAAARGDTLLFLHADTRLPPEADRLIAHGLAHSGRLWGRFDVRIVGAHRALPTIAWFMNRRSRVTGIATGDQGIFVRRRTFEAVGGYPAIRLMEDIALSRTLKRQAGAPLCLDGPIETSGRRWDTDGALSTVLLMWRLRLAYFLGADPDRLEQVYYARRP